MIDIKSKPYELFWNLYNNNQEFKEFVTRNMQNGKIHFFGEEEWTKIENQNFPPINKDIKNFKDMFLMGYNIGNCVGITRQLSYSYDECDIVSGILPLLKGTLNARELGGHAWLEVGNSIIDTSLMLVIDKSLKDVLGYKEEERLTSFNLKQNMIYQKRKEFVNDENLKRKDKC